MVLQIDKAASCITSWFSEPIVHGLIAIPCPFAIIQYSIHEHTMTIIIKDHHKYYCTYSWSTYLKQCLLPSSSLHVAWKMKVEIHDWFNGQPWRSAAEKTTQVPKILKCLKFSGLRMFFCGVVMFVHILIHILWFFSISIDYLCIWIWLPRWHYRAIIYNDSWHKYV